MRVLVWLARLGLKVFWHIPILVVVLVCLTQVVFEDYFWQGSLRLLRILAKYARVVYVFSAAKHGLLGQSLIHSTNASSIESHVAIRRSSCL